MKRLFGNIRMGWLSVILFAVCTGIYTGSVMLIPFLRDTYLVSDVNGLSFP